MNRNDLPLVKMEAGKVYRAASDKASLFVCLSLLLLMIVGIVSFVVGAVSMLESLLVDLWGNPWWYVIVGFIVALVSSMTLWHLLIEEDGRIWIPLKGTAVPSPYHNPRNRSYRASW